MTHTKDTLAGELRKIGLNAMAEKAASGWYHDFLSPLPFPELQLASDLEHIGTPEARALLMRHLDGEFDATVEEGEEWAASEDGRRSAKLLYNGQ